MKLKRIVLFFLFICLFTLYTAGCGSKKEDFIVTDLKVCHRSAPVGLDEDPVFSWKMESGQDAMEQSAYQILVGMDKDHLNEKNCLWDSGRISSCLSAYIPYAGEVLLPMTTYYWKVSVYDGHGHKASSAVSSFETGLLGKGMTDGEHSARWLTAPSAELPDPVYSPSLSKLLSYTGSSFRISFDMQLGSTEAGVLFGASGGRYGSMYLCRVCNREEPSLEILQMDNGTFLNEGNALAAFPISGLNSENLLPGYSEDKTFHVSLLSADDLLEISVGNVCVGVMPFQSIAPGSIGCYKSRGTSYAYLDNLSVAGQDDALLLTEDFQAAETCFSPYYVPLEEGALKIGSGMLLAGTQDRPAPLFYREFTVENKPIATARLYMTALGSFDVLCNGQPVSDEFFAPGKLLYNQCLAYSTLDCTALLKQGCSNALGLTLLHGWYDRAVGYPEIFSPWGEKNALKGMLQITFTDGSIQTILTDEDFLCLTNGPVRYDDIYQGEFYDTAYEVENFGMAGMDTSAFIPCMTDAVDARYLDLPLFARSAEPIRCCKELTPVSVTEPSPGTYVYDFGQNFAGTCRLDLSDVLPSSDGNTAVITLRYGEALNDALLDNSDDIPGTVWTENLLTADATDYLAFSGKAPSSYTPAYTYHGFRYLQLTGLSSPLPLEKVKGLALSSDLQQTGSFECSNELLNRFYQNTLWSQRSNFMDNPTDCAQRDERHGWAGDAQIFSLAASYHADTYLFYRKYLRELSLLQTDGGSLPDMAPRNFGAGWDGRGGAASNNCWGDAAMVITWNLYMQYGDISILEENYEMLTRWVDVLAETSDDFIRSWGGYGDHLSLEDTPSDLSDTAWCAHSADLLSRIAALLERTEDAAKYRRLYEDFKTAWQDAYLDPEGLTVCDTQTSYVLGLAFGLFPDELRPAALQRLQLLIEYGGYRVQTGFSGISCLFPVLFENQLSESAYDLLLSETAFSLLYPVLHDATTTYEMLSGYTQREDGTYHLDGSLNHYAFGSPVSCFYTDILGIKADAASPGYQHFFLRPSVNGNLSYARGSYESTYGTIRSSFERQDASGAYTYSFRIPANTSATLYLPALSPGKTYLVNGREIPVGGISAEGFSHDIDENVPEVHSRAERGRFIDIIPFARVRILAERFLYHGKSEGFSHDTKENSGETPGAVTFLSEEDGCCIFLLKSGEYEFTCK